MIKFTIGRDPDNRYVIFDPNSIISKQHAVINQYSDGRITIADQSTNGTSLNDAKLPKNQEINIKRGDSIVFADIAPIEWSRIPQINFPSNIDREISIGRAPENSYVTKSESTGRNHAILIITKDGKYFILDQSKNGTKVDSERLPIYQFKKIKNGQKITLGNEEVLDWFRIGGPGIPVNQKRIIVSIGVLILLGLLAWWKKDLIIPTPPPPPVKTVQEYKKSIVMVYNKFFYTLKDSKGVVSYLGRNKRTVTNESDLYLIKPFEVIGSGFIVSNTGQIVTNRHVAEPWKENELKQNLLIHDGDQFIKLIYSGKSVSLGIIANEQTINKDNFSASLLPCDASSVKSSNDPTIDLSIIQLTAKVVPTNCEFINKNDIISREEFINVQELDDVVIAGYPFGTELFDGNTPTIQATLDQGKISMIKRPFEIQYNANTAKGASGAPVIHTKTGKIIGINTKGYLTSDHNTGVISYLINDLIVN